MRPPSPLSDETMPPESKDLESDNSGTLENRPLEEWREGGNAGWACVLGSFLALFCTFGWLNALGLFQTYYEEKLLSTYSASSISWIFTVQLSLMFSGGVLYGRIIDTYGTNYVAIPCTICCTLCIALLSLCTEYYQVFLAQGLGFGIGAAGLWSCSLVSVSQWFDKRRALALGIVAAGSSTGNFHSALTGGIVHPIYLHILIDRSGFPAALRWSALVVGLSGAAACLLIRTRLPTKKWDREAKFFDTSLFKQPTFLFYSLGSFFVIWGLFAPWNYLPSMSLQHGFSQNMAVYTIPILNAGSVIGRILPAYLADVWGRFNLVCTIALLTGITLLAFWLPLEVDSNSTHAQILAFGATYGFASGAFISTMMPCVADLGPVNTLGQRYGVYQIVLGLSSLTGLPIAGALIPKDGGRYTYLIVFSGACVMVGSTLICFSLVLRVGRKWKG
ncbi:MFS transporter [Hyphodiscus hymeniophilus]|uniref:MFS transporter n=1 Tax=Hyphodiscus hymeniophilus TaxID=353542 RepID=A0A9P6VLA1_9HELO|nr:MFS transporter [Hyphodiscus hymeniophilus]